MARYGFNLGQIEGLDSSVQTVTVTIANAMESNTYTLTYFDAFGGIWADSTSPETFTVVLAPSRTSDDGFALNMRAYDASDVGDTYNVTLAKEEVAKNFVDATVKAINQSGYPYITNNTDVYSGSVVVDEEHSGSPISIISDFPTDIPVESIPELTVKINGNSTTYSYSRGEHTFTYQTDDNTSILTITQGSGDDATIEYVDFKSNLAGVYAITVNLEETTLDENFKAGVEEAVSDKLLPEVTDADNGKTLVVVNGAWNKAEGGKSGIRVSLNVTNGTIERVGIDDENATLGDIFDYGWENVSQIVITEDGYVSSGAFLLQSIQNFSSTSRVSFSVLTLPGAIPDANANGYISFITVQSNGSYTRAYSGTITITKFEI